MTDQTMTDDAATASETPAETKPVCCLGDKCTAPKGADPLLFAIVRKGGVDGEPLPIHGKVRGSTAKCCADLFEEVAKASGAIIGKSDEGVSVRFLQSDELKEIRAKHRADSAKAHIKKVESGALKQAKSVLDGLLGDALRAAQ